MAIKLDKQLLKKWWFWAITVVVLGLIGLVSGGGNTTQNSNTNTSNNSNQQKAVTYAIEGEVLGEYGKEITLNKGTDMPVKKYLYKLPAGSYKVTTTYDKMASFFIVKDDITVESGNSEYPEALNYVGGAYLLTAGDNDFNGRAKKEVAIALGSDESIQVAGTEELNFEKQ